MARRWVAIRHPPACCLVVRPGPSSHAFSAHLCSCRGSVSSLSASKEVAIRIRDVSITYRANLQKAPTLKNTLVSMGRRQSTIREIHALKNVSFDIHQGQVMGVIGANGAGKSTLMRTVAGILAPSTGRIDVYGRVSTLLALGVGFNSALSGKENVCLLYTSP